MGERFSSRILDYLLKKQLDAGKGSSNDPLASVFLIISRSGPPEDDVEAAKKLAPAIMIYGYVEDLENGTFSAQTRVNRINADLSSVALINKSVEFQSGQDQFEEAANSISKEIYFVITENLNDAAFKSEQSP